MQNDTQSKMPTENGALKNSQVNMAYTESASEDISNTQRIQNTVEQQPTNLGDCFRLTFVSSDIATRYDKTSSNFLGAIHMAGAVILLN